MTSTKPARQDDEQFEKAIVETVSGNVAVMEGDADLEGEVKVTFKTKLAIATLMVMYESYLFTQQMPASLLAYINADVGPDSRYPWIAISWNLGAAIIVTVGSRISDIVGRRWFLIFGASAAAVGALVGATSQSITQSILSGVIFGIGGGFQEMCFACAQELVPKKYRFRTLGYLIFANHFSASAILIGYAFVAYTEPRWRSMYWWCFAWECLAAILLFFFYHPPNFRTKHKEDYKTRWQLVKELDYVGLILFSGGCLFILLGLNWGGSMHPWRSSWTIGTIVAGGLCLIALGFWDAYMPLAYPILPPHLFSQWRRFTSYVVVCFVVGMLLYSLNVIWPLQSTLLFIPANQTIIRGVYASLANYGVVLAGYYCVLIMPKLKHEKVQIIALLCVVTALLGSMASVGIHDKGQAIATVILVQAANLPINPLSFGMVGLHLADQTNIGVAVGLLSTFRLLGGAVSTAVYTSIQTDRFEAVLPELVRRAAMESDYSGSFTALLNAAGKNTAAAYASVPDISNQTVEATELAVRQAHVKAYSLVYLISIAFGCIAILSAMSIKSIEDNQRTKEVSARLENDEESTETSKS